MGVWGVEVDEKSENLGHHFTFTGVSLLKGEEPERLRGFVVGPATPTESSSWFGLKEHLFLSSTSALFNA